LTNFHFNQIAFIKINTTSTTTNVKEADCRKKKKENIDLKTSIKTDLLSYPDTNTRTYRVEKKKNGDEEEIAKKERR